MCNKVKTLEAEKLNRRLKQKWQETHRNMEALPVAILLIAIGLVGLGMLVGLFLIK